MLLGTRTMEEAIVHTGGRSRGFDYLRIGLSISVVIWHSLRTSYPGFFFHGVYRPVFGLILPMFFALSGYLISGSLTRSRTVHEFAILRAIRIVPALAVETVISAVVIGTVFTTLPLAEFVRSHVTHLYFLNILGYPHYFLPGVFEHNPFPKYVNASIWTIPFELECYLLIVALLVTTIVSRPRLLTFAAVALQIALPLYAYTAGKMMNVERPIEGRVLVLSFLFGVVLYTWRKRVLLSPFLFVLSIAATMALLTTSLGSYFVAFPAAYATIYLGLLNPPKIPVVMDGDYSYGIYLYSFPLQQVIALLLPSYRHWYVNAVLAIIASGLCAAFSWHVVEKRALQFRKPLVGLIDRAIDRIRGRKPRRDPAMDSVLDVKAVTDHYPRQSGPVDRA